MKGNVQVHLNRKHNLLISSFIQVIIINKVYLYILGYMEVIQIPRGSVHIEVKEVAMSKNYIGKSWFKHKSLIN